MDTNAGVNQLGETGNIGCQNIYNFDEHSVVMEAEDIVCMPSSPSIHDNGGCVLIPITPDLNKENSDMISSFASPLTLSSHMIEDDETPSTPKDVIFDSFAPGPDSLMMAPIRGKHLDQSQSYVARRLNFNSLIKKSDREERICQSGFEDDMLLEAVNKSLLEFIICKKAEEILGEISNVDSDAFMTPCLVPRLTGIADTCPGAPMKAVKKSRNIDLSLCRKLDFEF